MARSAASLGNWHTLYTRMNRWSKSGVLDPMFEQLQRSQRVRIRIEAVPLDRHAAWIAALFKMSIKRSYFNCCGRVTENL